MTTAQDQLEILATTNSIESFSSQLKTMGQLPLMSRQVDIFQMNVGKLCNLQCSHCHVDAGPDKLTENMSRETFETCLKLIAESDVQTVDLTGGAPEMNPSLEWFITEVSKLNRRVIVRSNLTVLTIPKYAKFYEVFESNKVEVVASLPCYLEDNVDQQRGTKVFRKSIEVLQKLNEMGYGKAGTGLNLNLVHNPVGANLPPEQSQLEIAYKKHLKDHFDVVFNNLFCITNMPISRYLDALRLEGNYEAYMMKLVAAFNPASVDNVMCRNTISISWDGFLYDCDFNQMLGRPVKGRSQHVNNYDAAILNDREIVLQNHCYGCTAGAGSSCQGTTS
ncbi:radical SAM/Cys-rich domain protein [bacterium]|jgi:radical SAM/Cys-rich protein|nr:radical SAM/Cys-rich domain protein [bacterium]